jgi:pyroglutamyl-peptidase
MPSTPLKAPLPKVLLTGFEPFGGDSLNPSWMAVEALQGQRIAGHRIVAACLPTVFDDSLEELDTLLRRHQPVLVIGVGQAGGRAALSLERIAININDARIADNSGAQPVDTPVVNGGPAAYFSTLPIKAMLLALRAEGIAAEVSQTAGTFVCNHVFYGLMHLLASGSGGSDVRGGFIHVPLLPEQGEPSMALDRIVKGLETVVRCALGTQRDVTEGAGALN